MFADTGEGRVAGTALPDTQRLGNGVGVVRELFFQQVAAGDSRLFKMSFQYFRLVGKHFAYRIGAAEEIGRYPVAKTVTARGRGRAAAPGGVRLYESGLIQRDVRNQQVTGRSDQFRSRSIGCRAGTLFGCSDRRIRIRLL